MAHINKDRIKETTTTTGTGPFTVAGAVTGFKPFSAVCAVGDTFRGVIQAVDSSGVPTGEWQSGTFVYSAANQVTTLVVEESSTGSAVSFSAGTKQVLIGLNATQGSWIRERLTTARTYYVRTDGSDANTGLTNTSGGAFLTIQKAVDTFSKSIDLNGFDAIIQVADGTYTTPVEMRPLVGCDSTGYKRIQLIGNATTPANVIIITTSASAISNRVNDVRLELSHLKVQTTTSGNGLQALGFGSTIVFNNLVFGACADSHIFFATGGAVAALGNYTIAGSAAAHVNGYQCGRTSISGRTITLSGTPAFSTAFAVVNGTAYSFLYGNTYSGSATGPRYLATYGGFIDTQNAGATALPGSSAGSVSTGGQYY